MTFEPNLEKIKTGDSFEAKYNMPNYGVEVTAFHQGRESYNEAKLTAIFNETVKNQAAIREKSPDGFNHDVKYLRSRNLPVSNIVTQTTIESTDTIDKVVKISTKHFTNWARLSETGQVVGNNARDTEHVQMLRAWNDVDEFDNKVTTNYLGRADTLERQKEQVQFILENELSNNHSKLSPSLKVDPDNENKYTLTYVVNSLTKHGKLSDLSPLDERESLRKEQKLLSEDIEMEVVVKGITYTVSVKPIHIHQNISGAGELSTHLLNDNLSGRKLERDINKSGIYKLYEVALLQNNKSPLVINLLRQLERPSELSVRTKFIYMDILQRLLGLTAVYHCKSSVDRGGTAVAIGATNAHFLRNGRVNSIEEINGLIDSEEYKKMFLAQLTRAHQETLPARYEMDENKNITGKKGLGLKMYGSLLTDSLPKGMTIETLWEKSPGLRKLTAIVATIAYVLFYPIVIALMATIGHLVLGFAQLVTIGTKGKDIAGRMGNFHALPYSLTPWNMDKAHHRHINYSDETMKTYALLSKARSKHKKSTKTEKS